MATTIALTTFRGEARTFPFRFNPAYNLTGKTMKLYAAERNTETPLFNIDAQITDVTLGRLTVAFTPTHTDRAPGLYLVDIWIVEDQAVVGSGLWTNKDSAKE